MKLTFTYTLSLGRAVKQFTHDGLLEVEKSLRSAELPHPIELTDAYLGHTIYQGIMSTETQRGKWLAALTAEIKRREED